MKVRQIMYAEIDDPEALVDKLDEVITEVNLLIKAVCVLAEGMKITMETFEAAGSAEKQPSDG